MKKILLATLLSLSAMTANATDKEIKIEVPTDVPELMFTEAHKTDLTQYCTNAFAVGSAGVFVPALNIMKMAIVYPDAPLAKQYFPEEVVAAGRQSYIVSLEKNPDQRLLLAITDAWRHLIKIKGEDEAFNLAIKVYNDSANACNKKYTGGEQEMFKLIR